MHFRCSWHLHMSMTECLMTTISVPTIGWTSSSKWERSRVTFMLKRQNSCSPIAPTSQLAQHFCYDVSYNCLPSCPLSQGNGFRHPESSFSNLLSGPWTQLINWAMLCSVLLAIPLVFQPKYVSAILRKKNKQSMILNRIWLNLGLTQLIGSVE